MAAKELLDSGDVGRLLFAESHYAHDMRPVFDATPRRYKAPQDFIYGGACHSVDRLRWIASDILDVSCYGQASGMDSRYSEGMMDNFLRNLRFENEVIGRMMAIFGLVELPQPMNGLAVYGTKRTFVEDIAIFDCFERTPEWKLNFRPETGHGNEVLRYMRQFEECVADDRKPLVDEIEGARCIPAYSAARESAQSRQPVKAFNDF